MYYKVRNNYGFTLIEVVATIAILAIISGIIVLSYSKILSNTTIKVYENYENTMKSTAQLYYLDNPDLVPNINTISTININTLLRNGLLEIDNPDKKGEICTNSYVKVTRDNDTGHINLSYKVCLICSKYESKDC